MAIIKCKMCGGDLALVEGSVIAECEYCGTTQTVPAADDEKKLILFERAERLRRSCEFDKASGVYETIVADFRTEPEAYWGLVLCKYGIEYVDDPATGKKVPTCHRSSFDSVMDDENFEQTLENADAVARKVYREEAKRIEEIRKGIIEVSSKEEPYDIFICYKETDENGGRTLDSVLAQDIYDALTAKDFRVFFARITLEDKLGQEYEPYIFAALNSAKVMLSIGTDYEHFNAVWVKNEWSRYLKLMTKDKEKHLVPCFKGIDAYDLPKEFAKLQAQDLGKVGAIQDLLRGIEKLIQPAPAITVTAPDNTAKTADLLKQGNDALAHKSWMLAASRFDAVLVNDPECAEAYIGKLLTQHKLPKKELLKKRKKKLEKDELFRVAMDCASESLRQELESYSKAVKRKILIRTWLNIVVPLTLILFGWLTLEIIFQSTARRYESGDLPAEKASAVFSALSWYKSSAPGLLFSVELEAGNYSQARIYQPEHIVLLDRTIGHFSQYLIETTPGPITKIELPDGLIAVPDRLFCDLEQLISVTIPDSVTTIGRAAFSGCSSLTDITIPDGVTTIDRAAFYKCSSLTDIVIPDSVTRINSSAFDGCTSLQSVTIPASVTDLGGAVFLNCENLKVIYCEAEEQPEGWNFGWNYYCNAEVIWGATP